MVIQHEVKTCVFSQFTQSASYVTYILPVDAVTSISLEELSNEMNVISGISQNVSELAQYQNELLTDLWVFGSAYL